MTVTDERLADYCNAGKEGGWVYIDGSAFNSIARELQRRRSSSAGGEAVEVARRFLDELDKPAGDMSTNDLIEWAGKHLENAKRAARALLATAEEAERMAGAWRSMKTAPKNGDPILLCRRARKGTHPYLVVGYWNNTGYEPGLCWRVVGGRELDAPDAWLPLSVLPSYPGVLP